MLCGASEAEIVDQTWISFQALPVSSRATWGQLFFLTRLVFPFVKREKNGSYHMSICEY